MQIHISNFDFNTPILESMKIFMKGYMKMTIIFIRPGIVSTLLYEWISTLFCRLVSDNSYENISNH